MDNAYEWVVLFRIVERITLSVIVVIVSVVVMIAFWRSIQKIDFQMSREKIGVGGSVVFGTPVFVLLAMVGYAFVSLSNPISVRTGEGPDFLGTPAVSVSGAPATGQFTGMTSDGDSRGGQEVDNTGFERRRAVEKVMSLNCLVQKAGDMSARVQDDLAAVKLQLLEPVWSEGWGNVETFADWALGRSDDSPNAAVRAVYQETHPLC